MSKDTKSPAQETLIPLSPGETSAGATYRHCAVPHESAEILNAELEVFFAGVRALRIKHRIREVYLIVSDAVRTSEETEAEMMSSAHIGNPVFAESMTAWAFGREQLKRQQIIGELHAHSFLKEHNPRRTTKD